METRVDLITDRSMQYIYTLQGDPEQIIEKLNDRSYTMEQAVKGNTSSSTSSHSAMSVGSHCMFHDKIIYLPKSINICFLNIIGHLFIQSLTDTDNTVFIESESIVVRASDNSTVSMSSPNEEGTLSSPPVEDDINSGRDNAKSVQRSSRELIENCPAPERDNQVSHKDQRKNNI